jgi:F-type H+-transporting ATPase subunit a
MSSLESANVFLPALQLPGLTHDQALQVEYTWLAMIIVIALVGAMAAGLKRVPGGFQNAMELLLEFITGFMEDIIGPRWPRYFPLVITAFLLVIVSNYLGLMPGCIAPTGSINTTAGFAIVVFLYYNGVGVALHGIKYFKHFLGPIPIMAPLMLPLEIISELARPFALSVRLFANMMAGHVIVGLLYAAFFLGAPVAGMLFEGCVTAPIQAFVFSLLTMIYLGGAVLADEEH